MQAGAVKTHQIGAYIFLAGVLVQFFFAGIGAFGAGWVPHLRTGDALTGLSLILLVLAVLGRRSVSLTAVMFGLVVLQQLLVALANVSVAIASLHGVNAAVILVVAHQVARGTGLAVPGAGPAEASAPRGAERRVA